MAKNGQVQRLSSREWRTIETLFFANPFQLFGSHSLKIEKKIGILFQAERKRERPEGLRPQDYLESYFALGSKGSLMHILQKSRERQEYTGSK